MLVGRRSASAGDDTAPGRWRNLPASVANAVRRPMGKFARLGTSLRALGPYVALALTLPGGTLIALALLGMRHRTAIPPLRTVVLAAVTAAVILLPGSG